MPGLDHEVHPLTRKDDGHRYGCHNRKPFKPYYYAPNREYLPDGRWFDTMIKVEHKTSTDCRFDLSLKDSPCNTCPHQGSGEKYDQLIRSQGT